MAEKTALQIERERVDHELQVLQLEELRENSERRRAIRDQKQHNQTAYQTLLAENNAVQKMAQDDCPHRKGGKDLEGLRFGSSGNYSVVKHTLPMGDQIVVCQRCMKVWEKPVVINFKVKADYVAALREYKHAIDMPTDNVASGTRMFAFVAGDAA